MKTLIIGLGVSGKSAAELLISEGISVVAAQDQTISKEEENRFPVVRASDPFDFSEIDQVVVSPGVSPSHPLYARALELGLSVIGEVELALQRLPHRCLGVTGTNGKTTVCLMIEHVLNYCGIKAKAVGNIGVPLSTYCLKGSSEEILIVELSSYQLETVQTAAFEAGIILNISADHLDRYSSLEAYAKAKCRLQRCLKGGGAFYVDRGTFYEYPHLLDQKNLEVFSPLEEGQLCFPQRFSKCDKENGGAAWAVVKGIGVAAEQFSQALATFQKPPHRIEFVAEWEKIAYYNDSKGTNVDAVIRAVEAMPGQVVLIAGGVHKGASYTPWKGAFARRVKKIILLGEAAPLMEEELSGDFLVQKVGSIEEAVKAATQSARPGECVLLSPGCSSFDMFENYSHRGEAFKRCVYDLQERREKKWAGETQS